jgi:hypothetical protein
MSVAFCISVHFEQQIVPIYVLQVDTVEVATFEVRIESQKLSLVDMNVLGECGDKSLVKLFGVSVKDEVVDVLASERQISWLETFVYFATEETWVIFKLNTKLLVYLDLIALVRQLVLNALKLFVTLELDFIWGQTFIFLRFPIDCQGS